MTNWTRKVVGDRVGRTLLTIGLLAVGTVAGATAYRDADVAVAVSDAADKSGDITAINPARYVDTRFGERTIDGKFAGTGRVTAGQEFAIDIAGRPGIPGNSAAVMMNLTVVRPDAAGHVTVYPCGTERPNVSSVNYRAGGVAANAVLAKIGADGKVCVYSLSTTDLVVDVNAYVPPRGAPVAIRPVRHVDTRVKSLADAGDNPGRLTGGAEYKFTIAGHSGVPAAAGAVMMNVTAVRPDGPGHLAVYPCGTDRPNVSSINYQGDDVNANAVLSAIGDDGQVCVWSLRDTDLLIDVNGFSNVNQLLNPVKPARLVDTRPGETTVDGGDMGAGRLLAGREYRVKIAGRAGVKFNATAAMMNITAVRPDGPGHVTVYPCGTASPNVSSLNYQGGDVVPNAVFSKLGANGQICIRSLSDTDLIVDVNAFTPRPSTDPPTTPPPPSTDPTTTVDPTTVPPPPPSDCVIDAQIVATPLRGEVCSALIDLFYATSGWNWTSNPDWNTPTDPCTWYGVSCDGDDLDFVILDDNNLVGQIPSSIGDLVGINWLDLSENQLSGPVPSSIVNLGNSWKFDVLVLSGNECLTADDDTAAWLTSVAGGWDDGCLPATTEPG